MREFTQILITLKNAVIAKKIIQEYIPLSFKKACIVLNLLYKEGFILSYLYNKNYKKFVIYLNYIEHQNMLLMVKIFNKKRAQKYLTYTDLCSFNNNCTGEILYISTSKYGIIPHFNALRKQIGGKLLFLVR